MRRFLVITTVYLLLGTFVQAGVALLFCLFPAGSWSGGAPTQEEYRLWYDHSLNLPRILPFDAVRFRSPGLRAAMLYASSFVEPDGRRTEFPTSNATPALEILFDYEAGWPATSVRGALHQTAFGAYTSHPVAPVEALGPVRRDSAYPILLPLTGWPCAIPYQVQIRGTLLNALFYALLLWLLFFAPFATRRMLRRRRGQCEKCAYPIGVSPVCTECGAVVRPLVARSS